jgi:hypothetical protein
LFFLSFDKICTAGASLAVFKKSSNNYLLSQLQLL